MVFNDKIYTSFVIDGIHTKQFPPSHEMFGAYPDKHNLDIFIDEDNALHLEYTQEWVDANAHKNPSEEMKAEYLLYLKGAMAKQGVLVFSERPETSVVDSMAIGGFSISEFEDGSIEISLNGQRQYIDRQDLYSIRRWVSKRVY